MSSDPSVLFIINALDERLRAAENKIESLEARVTKLESPVPEMPDECRDHTCTYYTHYLMYGPAELTHEGYHHAEAECTRWQERCIKWMDENPTGQCPYNDITTRWEKRVRA